MAFTTYKHVHWSGPVIGSIPFGAGTYFIFTGVFTYLVTAYGVWDMVPRTSM